MEEHSAAHRSPSVNNSLSDKQNISDVATFKYSESTSESNARSEEEEGAELLSEANMLKTQYQQSGGIDNLNKAIDLLRRAVELIPHYHPSYSAALNLLGLTIILRYQQIGDTTELAECVSLHRNALALRPQGHQNRGDSLVSLANALLVQYSHNGNMNTLAEGISLHRDALGLFPEGHPDRSRSLNNLGNGVGIYYQQSGDINALAECITLRREALELRPQGHPQRGTALNNLAVALHLYYEQNGDMDASVECISLNREALELRPQGHPQRGMSFNNLADILSKRYDQTGDLDTLSECISLYRSALALFPQGHPDRSESLNGLAEALYQSNKQSGGMDSLTECISLHRNALALRLQGDPRRGMSLESLANTLLAYYEQSGSVDALEECINLLCDALVLQPKGNSSRSETLYSLCKAYIQQFDLAKNEQTLQNALTRGDEILGTLPHGHPMRQDIYHLMAHIRLKDSSHYSYEKAIDYLNLAVTYTHALPRRRLQDAIETLRSVEQVSMFLPPEQSKGAQQILDLYISTAELLPLVANYGLSTAVRLCEISNSGELCRPAATCAIKCNQLCVAIQLHEEGKALFWSQALRLQSSALDALPFSDREKLRSLFRQLEHDSTGFSGELRDRADLERRVEHRRQLNKQAEMVIEDIRQRPGFDQFLKIPLYEQLRHAASSGFIVVLITNEASYFAIVIQADSPPRCITLDRIQGNTLHSLCKSMSASGMRNYEQVLTLNNQEEQSTRAITAEGRRTPSPLTKIWRNIVKPVIDGLLIQRHTGRDRPRVHWCPSGDLLQLPLHAAGIYDGDTRERVCAADYIVSSYTPSLSSLLKAREGFMPIPRCELHAALYANSGGHGRYAVISKVSEEVQIAARILASKSAVVDHVVHGASTAASILEGATKSHILHLSCHGMQHEDPLESYFALQDQALTISNLMELDLKNAVLAYLSACYTARGDKNQPDQAVHLAASMLFCGFRSVVATMWAMYDNDGPKVAEWFYEALLENEVICLDDIPYALDTATTKLRQEGVPARHWATYMHLGA